MRVLESKSSETPLPEIDKIAIISEAKRYIYIPISTPRLSQLVTVILPAKASLRLL